MAKSTHYLASLKMGLQSKGRLNKYRLHISVLFTDHHILYHAIYKNEKSLDMLE